MFIFYQLGSIVDNMATVNKILVGVDGSAHSMKAAEYAARMASTFGASVTLMFVAPEPHAERFSPRVTTVPERSVIDTDKFGNAPKVMEGLKVPFNTVVERGNPAKILINRAGEGYDMVIMGSRGEGQVEEFLMGSVSSRVAQHVKIPILLVP
jgi:nucleotide-binding universal stress UspA family protein